MELIHLRPQDYVTSRWSGGTTTQLTIAPEETAYADRDFLWRVSSAAVSVKESDFTSLPDYHRLISVLKGEMILSHNGGEPLTLHPYEIHAFEGGDDTHSWGQCTDFNLMLRRDAADGMMESLHLEGQSLNYAVDERTEELLIYCAQGSCTAGYQGEKHVLNAGESLLARQSGAGRVTLETADTVRVMICQMWRI